MFSVFLHHFLFCSFSLTCFLCLYRKRKSLLDPDDEDDTSPKKRRKLSEDAEAIGDEDESQEDADESEKPAIKRSASFGATFQSSAVLYQQQKAKEVKKPVHMAPFVPSSSLVAPIKLQPRVPIRLAPPVLASSSSSSSSTSTTAKPNVLPTPLQSPAPAPKMVTGNAFITASRLSVLSAQIPDDRPAISTESTSHTSHTEETRLTPLQISTKLSLDTRTNCLIKLCSVLSDHLGHFRPDLDP